MSFIENANFIMTAAKNTRKIIGLITIAFLYSGCSSDKTVVSDTVNEASEIDRSDSDNGKSDPIAVATPSGDTVDPFTGGGDITGAMATNRSGDCTNYVNDYSSNVTYLQNNQTFTGDVSISVSGGKCVFSSNGIPNHDMGEGGRFATPVSEVNETYEFTANPSFASSPDTDIWKGNVVLLNGGLIELLAAACYDQGNDTLGREKIGCGGNLLDHPWRYDPMSPLNSFGTDIHNAHTQPTGLYHYHADPNSIFENNCDNVSSASPVIGFAADGFPLYGSCIDDNGTIRKAQSSYQLKNDGGPRQAVAGYQTPTGGTGSIASSNYDGQFRGDWEYVENTGDLDECNGMTVDGQYGYYVTDSFPWVLACYSGTPDRSFR